MQDCKSSDLDEEQDRERIYFVLAQVEQPINNAKVDIPLADVKNELGTELNARTSTLIALGAGQLEQINQEII